MFCLFIIVSFPEIGYMSKSVENHEVQVAQLVLQKLLA